MPHPRTLIVGLAAFAMTLTGCTGAAEWSSGDPAAAPDKERPEDAVTQVGAWSLVKEGLPDGAAVQAIAHHDGAVYLVVQAGAVSDVFALHRGASAWVNASPERHSTAERFHGLAVIDRALYLTAADDAASSGSLYRVRFSDEPWVRVATAPALPLSAIARKSGRILVAAHGAAATAGLYGSSDGGQTWTKVAAAEGQAAFFSRPIRTFAASPAAQRLFATGEVTSGFGALYASDDGGATWTRMPVGGDVQHIHASGAYVLLSSSTEGELRSDNYGSTFHPLSLGTRVHGFHVADTRAFAATAAGVSVSDDGGATWRDASEGLPSFARIDCLYLAGSSLVAAGDSGVFVANVQ